MTRKDLYVGEFGPKYEAASIDLSRDSMNYDLRQKLNDAIRETDKSLKKTHRAYREHTDSLKESFYLRGFHDGTAHAEQTSKGQFTAFLSKLKKKVRKNG